MRLRGIDFGSVWDASGIRNFDGRGWWFHNWLRPFGLRLTGATFVAKTTTTFPRLGNMPLRSDGITPIEVKPKCIVVKMREGVALNAVGLSGPGAKHILIQKWWHQQTAPFFISWMAVTHTLVERELEAKRFVRYMRDYAYDIQTPFGLQLNISCPNTGHDVCFDTVSEVYRLMDILGMLNVPIVPKISVTTNVETATKIAEHPACDAISVSNTVPWGMLPDKIDWKKLFGSDKSPLEKRFGPNNRGGLSGKPLLPLVIDWVTEAIQSGFPKPINAGGGILSKEDAIALIEAGAKSVSLGSVAFLRPWRVAGIIRAVHKEMDKDKNGENNAKRPTLQ